jgi:hypothetical protein
MILNTLNTLMRNDPAAAVKVLLLSAPIRGYLMKNLTDDQTKWLGGMVQHVPTSMLSFINSDAGKQLVQGFFQEYRDMIEPPAPDVNAPEDNFGKL